VDDKLLKYPKTDKFECIDTVGVPHPYCITPKHVEYAADNFHGMLGKDAIKEAEENGKARCGICGGKLSYDEHKTAVLVEVRSREEIEDIKEELREYLKSIVSITEADGFAGLSLIQAPPQDKLQDSSQEGTNE
jgi:hypothetical protein